jgi:hypothetical protein
LWWRTQDFQTSEFFPKAQSKAFCAKKKKIDLDTGAALTPRKKKHNSDQRECPLQA